MEHAPPRPLTRILEVEHAVPLLDDQLGAAALGLLVPLAGAHAHHGAAAGQGETGGIAAG
jgi:hypothetical protein